MAMTDHLHDSVPESCWPPVDFDCCDCWDEADEATQHRALTLAINLLWRLTGRQYDLCETTIRPCGPDCFEFRSTYSPFTNPMMPAGDTPWVPALVNGQWINCGTFGCCCDSACELLLPCNPAHEVVEVLIDGMPLHPVEYRIDNRRRLVRTNQQRHEFDTPFSASASGQFVYENTPLPVTAAGWDGSLEIPTSASPTPDTLVVDFGRPWPGERMVFWVPPAATLRYIGTGEVEVLRVDPGAPHGDAHATGDPIIELHGGVAGGLFVVQGATRLEVYEWAADDAGVELRGLSYLRPGESPCWPRCQDFAKDITEEGTFAITYRCGKPWPDDAPYIIGRLACEFLKACMGRECALPRRVQTLTRNGVTMQLVDDAGFLGDGLVGLTDVDQWIVSVNPYGLRESSKVYSVDRKIPRTTTWQGQ